MLRSVIHPHFQKCVLLRPPSPFTPRPFQHVRYTFKMVETKQDELKKTEHPTSPNLTIYKFPIPAIMSITHRATGIALSLGVAGIAIGMLHTPYELAFYTALVTSSAYAPLAKFGVAFPLIYHTLAGGRHLIWDQGKYLTLDKVYRSGYAIIAGSVVLSLAAAFISF